MLTRVSQMHGALSSIVDACQSSSDDTGSKRSSSSPADSQSKGAPHHRHQNGGGGGGGGEESRSTGIRGDADGGGEEGTGEPAAVAVVTAEEGAVIVERSRSCLRVSWQLAVMVLVLVLVMVLVLLTSRRSPAEAQVTVVLKRTIFETKSVARCELPMYDCSHCQRNDNGCVTDVTEEVVPLSAERRPSHAGTERADGAQRVAAAERQTRAQLHQARRGGAEAPVGHHRRLHTGEQRTPPPPSLIRRLSVCVTRMLSSSFPLFPSASCSSLPLLYSISTYFCIFHLNPTDKDIGVDSTALNPTPTHPNPPQPKTSLWSG